ncbi:hypothetical protein GUJ93_ZPchr0008g12372 [Zizania palustris]|uniref:Uncharacterized protein n=1 Tax=Zizania palustris TaxID=103762 RepID=A0A8J5RCX4_ZIZPA|nr:hypothetical protein GUJ93_ZPchr0008g12372 [Zizania palustris]
MTRMMKSSVYPRSPLVPPVEVLAHSTGARGGTFSVSSLKVPSAIEEGPKMKERGSRGGGQINCSSGIEQGTTIEQTAYQVTPLSSRATNAFDEECRRLTGQSARLCDRLPDYEEKALNLEDMLQ